MKDESSAGIIEHCRVTAAANVPISHDTTTVEGGNATLSMSTVTEIATSVTTTTKVNAALSKKTVQLENLGRNARERLEKERSKRRFIQRISIDDNIEPPLNGGSKTIATIAATAAATNRRRITRQQQQTSNGNNGDKNENSTLIETAIVNVRKRKVAVETASTRRNSTSGVRQRRQRRSSNDVDNDSGVMIDRWMPDISHILNNSSNVMNESTNSIDMNDNSVMLPTSSNTVQLHGLPIHTTIQQIRSFFTGLHIQRILLLLPYPTEMKNGTTFRLIDYDAIYCDRDGGSDLVPYGRNSSSDSRSNTASTRSNKNNTHNFRIERYDSNMVRLLVQFPTVPIATFAEQRSGEVIYTEQQHPSIEHENSHQEQSQHKQEETKQVGAAIAITIVPPAMASLMTKLLGIDVTERNTTTIEQTIEPIVQTIDSKISMTLWETVIDELSLNVDVTLPRKANKSYRSCLRVAISNNEIQELQNEKLQLQQEIDRIILVSSSSMSQRNNNSDTGDCYDWNRILLYLMSTTNTNCTATRTTTNVNINHDYGNFTKFACLMEDNTMLYDPQQHPIIHFTKEYIQLLQMYIQRIDTILAITNRKVILFKTNHV